MIKLNVFLLGMFRVTQDDKPLSGLESCKVQQLFAFLLLHPHQFHSRDMLIDLLWSEYDLEQGRKYLRQALWQLRSTLTNYQIQLIDADADAVCLRHEPDLWLDVTTFVDTIQSIRDIPADSISVDCFHTLQEVIQLYCMPLLEGWDADWIFSMRWRLDDLYIVGIDKLIAYCEIHGLYEYGIAYGKQLLHLDPTRERTHRDLMRLYYFQRDRTSAIRQYQRCCHILTDELDVQPSNETQLLLDQIQQDALPMRDSCSTSDQQTLISLLAHMNEMEEKLGTLRQMVLNKLEVIQIDDATYSS